MNILFVILGTLLIVAGLVTWGLKMFIRRRGQGNGYSTQEGKKAKRLTASMLLTICGIVSILIGNSFTVVPTGYTGVRTTFGLIDQSSCMPGFNLLAPFVQKISLVNNKQQDLQFSDKIWSETKEQTVVFMENTVVTYQVVPEASAWIYANVDNWVERLVDINIVSSALKEASRSLGADVVTDRGTIEPLAEERLQAALDEKYGENRIIVKNVILNNIDFEDSYNEAIAKKSQAIQDQQRQAIENQTNIDKAKAEAEAERERARGKADAELIAAEGKAKANKEIASSITAATQRQDAIQKWDGELPKYVGGEDATFGILESTASAPAE